MHCSFQFKIQCKCCVNACEIANKRRRSWFLKSFYKTFEHPICTYLSVHPNNIFKKRKEKFAGQNFFNDCKTKMNLCKCTLITFDFAEFSFECEPIFEFCGRLNKFCEWLFFSINSYFFLFPFPLAKCSIIYKYIDLRSIN